MKNRTSNLRIPRSDALPLSHRDFKASAVYYEVHMTHVLHTARISNVDNVMFVNRIRSLIPHMNSVFFSLSHACDKTNNTFLYRVNVVT